MRAHAAQIDLDVERTFPNHPDFRAPDKGAPGGTGAKLEPLRRVLMATAPTASERRIHDGRLNFVDGGCMLVLDRDATDHAAPDSETETTDPNAEEARASSEERAYWLCASLLEDRTAGYFPRFSVVAVDDLDALDADFRAVAPAAHRALDDVGCAVKFFCPRWLLCVMVGTAPTAVTLRVWDAVLVDSDRRPRDVPSTMRVGGARGARGGDGGRAGRGRGGRRDKIRGSRGGGRAGVSQTGPRRAYARRASRARRGGGRRRETRGGGPGAHARARPEADFRASTRAHALRKPPLRVSAHAEETTDAGTTAPRRLLRGRRATVVVVDDDAFAVDGDVARRDTDTTRVEFLSAARAKLAETMECALSPGFRRVRSRGRDAAARRTWTSSARISPSPRKPWA